ncbi:hypothetical protein F2P81_004924 [Scophthalmus maximus]|uniref:Uncharacterized protein n=1 Tax=Scophthalmus maximus TaxID=52904 RepID=A0A6A4TAU0_SCOMX|nr:hypothetical protein F2P81_004924 [Scophthalmus maximus]
MSYELCSFPAALFEGKEIFRKANKPQLAQAVSEFPSKKSNKTVLDSIPPTEHYVRDGGSLVPHLAWKKGDSYSAIADFTIRNYETEFVGRKDDFLSRSCNKQRLIDLMTVELEKKGCTIINALGDADVDIVKAAVKASEHQLTTLIGEDTDLPILLLYYAGTNKRGLYFRSDKSKSY